MPWIELNVTTSPVTRLCLWSSITVTSPMASFVIDDTTQDAAWLPSTSDTVNDSPKSQKAYAKTPRASQEMKHFPPARQASFTLTFIGKRCRTGGGGLISEISSFFILSKLFPKQHIAIVSFHPRFEDLRHPIPKPGCNHWSRLNNQYIQLIQRYNISGSAVLATKDRHHLTPLETHVILTK